MEPTNVEALKKYIPSSQVKIVPDAVHLVMWDNPEEFNRLLEEGVQEFVNQSTSEHIVFGIKHFLCFKCVRTTETYVGQIAISTTQY
jgi:hypothetical protein